VSTASGHLKFHIIVVIFLFLVEVAIHSDEENIERIIEMETHLVFYLLGYVAFML